MHRDLVDRRGWITEADYQEGLAFSQLLPGPLAAQLAMYIGLLKGGVAGAMMAAVTFVLPSFLMAMALGVAYVHYGRLNWIQGAFYGIGASVIAIIVQGAYKLSRKALRGEWFLWAVFGVTAVATAWSGTEMIWLILLSGVAVVLVRVLPRSSTGIAPATFVPILASGLRGPAPELLGTLFLFFLKAGAFVFARRRVPTLRPCANEWGSFKPRDRLWPQDSLRKIQECVSKSSGWKARCSGYN
jgi:chromate transporter